MNIVKYPDEFLHKPTKEVWLPLNEDHKSLIKNLRNFEKLGTSTASTFST